MPQAIDSKIHVGEQKEETGERAYLIDPERWAWSSTLGNNSTKDILDELDKISS